MWSFLKCGIYALDGGSAKRIAMRIVPINLA
jgi:hypothetical protein